MSGMSLSLTHTQPERRGCVGTRARNAVDADLALACVDAISDALTRALTRPYVGAHLQIGDKKFRVWRVKQEQFDLRNIEPGKVLAIKNGNISVKTADGCILLVEHEIGNQVQVGSYL